MDRSTYQKCDNFLGNNGINLIIRRVVYIIYYSDYSDYSGLPQDAQIICGNYLTKIVEIPCMENYGLCSACLQINRRYRGLLCRSSKDEFFRRVKEVGVSLLKERYLAN